MNPSAQEVTQLLQAWRNGDQTALDRLIPLVYEELRQLAKRYMARQAPGHTLQTAALINEAYIRLIDQSHIEWQGRAHFFAVCATIMRNILVDHFRRQRPKVTLNEEAFMSPEPDVDVMALDETLGRLAALDKRQSQVIELRFFGGLTEEEVAEVLNVSPITVKRDWKKARAWLYRELSGGRSGDT
jgi:RNA polymerase sigma factor (TIGR02999 family)